MPPVQQTLLGRTLWCAVGTVLLVAGSWAQEAPGSTVPSPAAAAPLAYTGGTASDVSAQALSWDQRITRIANDFLGTRYRLGGISQTTGLDCSGLIKQIWQRLGLVELPHQAASMAKLGTPVQLRDVQVGDLIFFNTTGKQNSHVGVYVGNGRFIHASSVLKKVTENSLSESYYQKTFNGIRRITGFGNAADAPTLPE
jgi:cell wall-associated NlpC family hydrolase